MGPTNRTLSISPDVNNPAFRAMTFDELRDAYKEQVRGLIDGGADLLLLETIFDTLNAKAGIVAIENVFEEKGVRLPLMISVTITDRSGRTLSGQTRRRVLRLDRARAAVQRRHQLRARRARHAPVPGRARAHRRLLRQLLPERRPAQRLRRVRRAARARPRELLQDFATSGFVNIVGGCCGTTPDHIAAIAQAVEGVAPRPVRPAQRTRTAATSDPDTVSVRPEHSRSSPASSR